MDNVEKFPIAAIRLMTKNNAPREVVERFRVQQMTLVHRLLDSGERIFALLREIPELSRYCEAKEAGL